MTNRLARLARPPIETRIVDCSSSIPELTNTFLPDNTISTIDLLPSIAGEHSAKVFAAKPLLRIAEGYITYLI